MVCPKVRFCFLVVLASLSFPFAGIAASLEAPKLVDIESVDASGSKSFKFLVRNGSEKILILDQVIASCSCTNVDVAGDDEIHPGEDRLVKGIVHAGSNIGDFETQVHLTVHEALTAEKSEVVVSIRGTVKAALVLSKSQIFYGSIEQTGKAPPMPVFVSDGNTREAWDGIQLENADDLDAVVEKMSAQHFKILLSLKPEHLPIGPFRRTVSFYPTLAGKKLAQPVKCLVVAQVLGPVTVSPSAIYLGTVGQATSTERSFKLVSYQFDLRQLGEIIAPDSITAKIVESSQDSAIVKCLITAPDHAGAFSQKIVLTHQSSGVKIEVPVLGLVSNSE